MDTFDLKKYLVENKLTPSSLKEQDDNFNVNPSPEWNIEYLNKEDTITSDMYKKEFIDLYKKGVFFKNDLEKLKLPATLDIEGIDWADFNDYDEDEEIYFSDIFGDWEFDKPLHIVSINPSHLHSGFDIFLRDDTGFDGVISSNELNSFLKPTFQVQV